jgi:hypothetical protein
MFTVSFESKHDLHAQLQKLHLLPEPEHDVTTATMSVEELINLVQKALPGKTVQIVDLEDKVVPVSLPVVPPPESVQAEKRGRGRPPKTKTEAAPEPAPEPAMTPAKMMEAAMAILTPLYNEATAKDAVLQLRDKYGVKKFALLPEDKTAALLADAKALAAQFADRLAGEGAP